jgi:hypothetical protein
MEHIYHVVNTVGNNLNLNNSILNQWRNNNNSYYPTKSQNNLKDYPLINHSTSIESFSTPYEFYFAYGANMDLEIMDKRKCEYIKFYPAILEGYVLSFDKVINHLLDGSKSKYTYSTIKKTNRKEDVVCGVLYILKFGTLKLLDTFETDYYRDNVVVCLKDDSLLQDLKIEISNSSSYLETSSKNTQYKDNILDFKIIVSTYFDQTPTQRTHIVSETYLQHIIKGLRNNKLPETYIQNVRDSLKIIN